MRAAKPVTPLTPSQSALVAQWLPLARLKASRVWRDNPFARLRLEESEAHSAGYVGLCHAARSFDPARGYSFGSYLPRAVYQAVMQAASQGGSVSVPPKGWYGDTEEGTVWHRAVHLTQGFGVEELVGELADPSADPAAEAAAREEEEALAAWAKSLLRRLPPKARRVVERHVMGGETQQAVAHSMGLTRQRVQQVAADALARLREMAGGGNGIDGVGDELYRVGR